MYKIDRRGGVQKSYTRTDPSIFHIPLQNCQMLLLKSKFNMKWRVQCEKHFWLFTFYHTYIEFYCNFVQ